MDKLSDQQIIEAWKENASPWVTAIREEQIESRVLVTNNAIIDAIVNTGARTCLDIGCGEGWLVRELDEAGLSCVGIDAIPELITQAKSAGGGEFQTVSYEDLSYKAVKKSFDVAVCNFSLLGKESVERIFRKVSGLLNNSGFFIVQTMHPIIACGELEYKDGWREGSWVGFNSDFGTPAPWYFRTIESWKSLYVNNGFQLKEVIEPLNPKTQVPASIIFIGIKDS